jgi:hypothetical protein
LGGLEGADAICNDLASEAGLPGTYMAWLSDTTSSPATRFPTKSTGPYVRTDTIPVAWNWDHLLGGELIVPIDRNEAGALISTNRETWTNTSPDGTLGSTDPNLVCDNWTSDLNGQSGGVGETNQLNDQWTASHSDPCNATWRLYCFQQS